MMSLKFNALLLTFLLAGVCADFCLGRYETTEPTAAGAVLPRVRKNTDATYRATASYNGKPVLHAEEKVINETWTYDVTYGPGATGKSTETGNAVIISAKSANPGTYPVSIKFTITFTIKTPDKNAALQFTIRREPYSGVGSATLNVKNGIFEVKIKPKDLIPQYTGDTKGYRNKLGIGEKATVLVFPEEGSTDTVVFSRAEPAKAPFSVIKGNLIGTNSFASSGTLEVWSKVNGIEVGPETIGITVIEPTGAGIVKMKGSGVFHVQNTASVGFYGRCYLTPDDVSFSAVEVHEGTCPAITTGYFKKYYSTGKIHPVGSWWQCDHHIDPDSGKRNTFGTDKISSDTYSETLQLPFSDGTFDWNIPWEFKCGTHTKQIAIMTQHMTIDMSGNMTISKGSVTVSAKVSDPTLLPTHP